MAVSHPSPELLAVLAKTPILTPPEGVVSNFVNPPTQAGTQIIVSSILLAFVLSFVVNRFYVKLQVQKRVTWDDATIIIGFLGSTAYYTSCTWGVKYGVGRHYWDLSVLQAMDMNLLVPSWLTIVLSPFTFLFLKSTFFILYLELFKQFNWLRVIIWMGLLLNSATYILFTILVFYFSTPSKGETWFDHLTSRKLQTTVDMSVPQSAIGLGIDLYILIIPIIAVSKLTMSLKRKIGVILIFLSGAMACICSACSIYYRVVLNHTPDTFWHLIPVNISTMCEMFVGVICACIPSAAYAARQKNSAYSKIVHLVSSSLDSLKSTRLGEKNSGDFSSRIQSTQSHPKPNMLKSTDRKYAEYFNLTDLSMGSQSFTNKDGKASITNYEPEPQNRFDGRGVLRKVDISVNSV